MSTITELFSVYVFTELNFISSMIYQINPDNQDGKPSWPLSCLLFRCQLSVLLIKNQWSWGCTTLAMVLGWWGRRSLVCLNPPPGKWTDLQSHLMPNRKYVNALQDDNKNRKKPQIIAWVAVLRQKHLYSRIQFLKSRLFVHFLKKRYHHLNEKIEMI